MISLGATVLAAALLTNATDVSSAVLSSRHPERFRLTGTLTFRTSNKTRRIALSDVSGSIYMIAAQFPLPSELTEGQTVRVNGLTTTNANGSVYAECSDIEILSSAVPLHVAEVTITELENPAYDNRPVAVRGTVKEVFGDEIDPHYIYLTLQSGRDSILVTKHVTPSDRNVELNRLRALTEARVVVTGLFSRFNFGARRLLDHTIQADEDFIRVLRPAADPFSAPRLEDERSHDVLKTRDRRLVIGTVLAIHDRRKIILKDTIGKVRILELSDETTLPPCGEHIEAVGIPLTDLYQINLSDVIWRTCPRDESPEPPAEARTASLRELQTDDQGLFCINPDLHGGLIALTGTIQDLPLAGSGQNTLILRQDGLSISVDASACPEVLEELAIGCTVTATGICFVETETRIRHGRFPRTTGLSLVLRTPADVTVLSRPPWWTPARLLIVIGSLLTALVGIFIWNRILNRLVDRRSRQLFREQVAHAGDKLKVGERTRLAVELHDSLSQTLTGVSFQIDAAEQARQKDPSQVKKYLDVARQTLQSCREELKNCLWDLRNDALEESNAEVAIRKTVEPQIGDAELTVDFKVSRPSLTDNTFHAILCILRELSVNAVRHGQARNVTLTGRQTKGRLTFSVSDDGIGFDPDNHPGVDEGHFGLLGVQERVEDMNGSLTIGSAPGRGTTVTVELKT